MNRITSKDNSLIKLYRKLCTDRNARYEHGLFPLEGMRLCRDALQSGVEMYALLTTESGERYNEEMKDTVIDDSRRFVISDSLGSYISDTKSPQGVFALCRMRETEKPVYGPEGIYLLADGLQDPGNMGTIIRTAEAMGITAVIVSAECPDLFSPKVIRSAMGSVFRQKLYVAQSLPEEIAALRAAGVECAAAMLDCAAKPLWDIDKAKGIAVVIGNEGRGVSSQVQEACSGSIYIPMHGAAESLNAACAASIIMWELSAKGRRDKKDN